jgi:hypothetical protein
MRKTNNLGSLDDALEKMRNASSGGNRFPYGFDVGSVSLLQIVSKLKNASQTEKRFPN